VKYLDRVIAQSGRAWFEQTGGRDDNPLSLNGYGYAAKAGGEALLTALVGDIRRKVSPLDGLRLLEVGCGAGAMTTRLAAGTRRPVAIDFSHAMLQRAGVKGRGTSLAWIEADALRLPFPDAHFDLITAAFGFRNLADYDAGLREIVRVLRPGAECGILDFGEPRGLLGKFYRVYFKHVLPAIGTVISGVQGPYRYLPASVERFPPPEEMLERMRGAGFREASWTPYTFGVAGVYRGIK